MLSRLSITHQHIFSKSSVPQKKKKSISNWPCGWSHGQRVTWGYDRTRRDSECSCTALVECSPHCRGSWAQGRKECVRKRGRVGEFDFLNSCSVLPGWEPDLFFFNNVMKGCHFFIIFPKLMDRNCKCQHLKVQKRNSSSSSVCSPVTVFAALSFKILTGSNLKLRSAW